MSSVTHVRKNLHACRHALQQNTNSKDKDSTRAAIDTCPMREVVPFDLQTTFAELQVTQTLSAVNNVKTSYRHSAFLMLKLCLLYGP